MIDLFKLCPSCKKKQIYSTKYVLKYSIENSSLCKKCSGEKQRIVDYRVFIFNGKWCKKCVKCQKNIIYSSRNSALKNKNIKCNSCAKKGMKYSDEIKRKLSLQKLGKNNPMFGKPSFMKGKHHTEETKYKLRIATIKDLRKKGLLPSQKNYNLTACKFIDNFNKEKGWNLQHALNGGEVEIYGYFVDGYDKERNIVFEYDEQKHRCNWKRQKDLLRQNRIIENIKPNMFIRYDEVENKLYDVISRKECL